MKAVKNNAKQSTREIILTAIKQSNEATVDSLAETADVSPVTVRHHLNSLLADGVLESTPVRRKVGRPYHVYTLTQAGHELFPQRYVRLSTRLLEELKDRFPPEIVSDLFKSVVLRIVEEHRPEFEPLDFEQRLDYVVNLLRQEGFLAQWEKTAEGYSLTEHNCPYVAVGQTHDEICSFDSILIASILETKVDQHSCVLNGDSCCEFVVSPSKN